MRGTRFRQFKTESKSDRRSLATDPSEDVPRFLATLPAVRLRDPFLPGNFQILPDHAARRQRHERSSDIPDEDAPFYYMFDSHRADNMQTLPWNPYAGIPMTIGEGIHWILNQKERETKKRPRR